MSSPILYDKMATNFENLGMGVLTDTITCFVDEERNGIFELEMEYPTTGALFHLLENDKIIKVDAGHELKGQLFRIKRITKTKEKRVRIYAQHISYLTQELALPPEITLNGTAQQALDQWMNAIIDDNPFTVFSDVGVTSVSTLSIQDFQNPRRVLGGVRGSILDQWGGEYKFDNYHISLLENRGRNSNTLIAYGRNLTDLQQEENIANTFTSLYPFAIYQRFSGEGEIGEDVVVTVPGFVVDSEHVAKFPNRRVRPMDFSSAFEGEVPTPEKLRQLAEQFIKDNDVGVPKVSLKVSFVDLTKSLGFAGLHYEQVNVCDVVPVYFEKLDIRVRAQINRIRWNALMERYEWLEIGDLRPTLSDKIRDLEDGINDIDRNPPVIGGGNIANITPGQVTNFKAVGGFKVIHLFWDPQGFHVAHFELHRSMVSDFIPSVFTRIHRGRQNGFSDAVGTDRQYFYKVQAVNHQGVFGEWSAEVSAQTVRIIDEDILFGPEIAQELRDLSKLHGILGPDTINQAHVVNGAITNAHIQNGAIENAHLGNAIIDAAQLMEAIIKDAHIHSLSADKIVAGILRAIELIGVTISGSVFLTDSPLSHIRMELGRLTLFDENNIQSGALIQSRLEFRDRFAGDNPIICGRFGRLHTAGDETSVLGVHMGAQPGYEARVTSQNPANGLFATRIAVPGGGPGTPTDITNLNLTNNIQMNGNNINTGGDMSIMGDGDIIVPFDKLLAIRRWRTTGFANNQEANLGVFTMNNNNAGETGAILANQSPGPNAGFFIGPQTVGSIHRGHVQNWDVVGVGPGSGNQTMGGFMHRWGTHDFGSNTAASQTWSVTYASPYSNTPNTVPTVICDTGVSATSPTVTIFNRTPQGFSMRLHRNGFTGPVQVSWESKGRRSFA